VAAEPDPVALLLARGRPTVDDAHKTRELVRARAALERNDADTALHELREARRVAVAQRKAGELLEVNELLARTTAASTGRTHELARYLASEVERDLRTLAAEPAH
jgi:hypothetical protein